jgi:hypothetical protein
MIRLLLLALGGWAAWRYRSQVKTYVDQQLPQVKTRAAEVLGEATKRLKDGLPASDAARRSAQER